MLNNVFLPHFTSYKTRRRGGPRCLLEQEFEERLCYERKRAERSRDSLILMLVHRNENHADLPIEPVLQAALNPIAGTIRDTDIVGWCRGRAVLGVLFTELKSKTSEPLIRILKEKIVAALSGALTRDDFQALQLSFHSFPEDFNSQKGKHALPPLIYPDVVGVSEARKAQLLVKRIMDLVGSAFALTILSPLFLLLALAIKCTSRGPVLFRQERLGQFGVPFVFLKFRSMYVSNSPAIHRDFVRSFIAGISRTARLPPRRSAASRSPTTRASLLSADLCAARAWMNCPSSGTFCAERCLWLVLVHRFLTRLTPTKPGTAAGCMKPSPASRDPGRYTDAAAPL